ncbi:MAG: zinc-binding dehydrogenase [Ignavibacteriales bacterium]|nr:zinc-binding dehydrogenase [Ignavibacteriales bacterium]
MAAILQKPRHFSLEQHPLPKPRYDEVLVRTRASGICTSELDMWEGKAKGLEFPRFIGHEPSGIVESVGSDVTSISVGDHVAAWSEGKSYAEYFVSRESHLYKLRQDTPFEQALGEPIACAVNGVRKADVQLNDNVCIVGCGFMGLIMLQVFKANGAGLLAAIDTRESILDLAKQLGATHIMNPRRVNVKKAVLEITEGRGMDIGVEGSGRQETLDMTSELVRMEGKLEVFGYHQGEPRKVDWAYWNWMAFQIINGHTRSGHIYVEGMKIGLRLLEDRKLNMKPLITHRFRLDEINNAFEIASAKEEGFVKGVITFEDGWRS